MARISRPASCLRHGSPTDLGLRTSPPSFCPLASVFRPPSATDLGLRTSDLAPPASGCSFPPVLKGQRFHSSRPLESRDSRASCGSPDVSLRQIESVQSVKSVAGCPGCSFQRFSFSAISSPSLLPPSSNPAFTQSCHPPAPPSPSANSAPSVVAGLGDSVCWLDLSAFQRFSFSAFSSAPGCFFQPFRLSPGLPFVSFE